MGERLGPRSCRVCGPTIQGCWKCGSKLGHRHVMLVGRDATAGGLTAVCDVHAPPEMFAHTRPASNGTRATVAVASGTPAKLQADRTRRRALALLRDRYRDEYEQLLQEVRG